MAGGTIVLLGFIVFVLLAIVLVTPDSPADARSTVTVTSVTPQAQRSGVIRLRTPRLLEAVARWSAGTGQATEYMTVGSGATLQQCLGYSAADGRWLIRVNDRIIDDLFHARLQQGDDVRLEFIPHS